MDDTPQPTPHHKMWPPYELISVVSQLALRFPELPRHSIIHAVNEAAALCPVSAGHTSLLGAAGQRVLDLQVTLRR